jgi:hypothetical protein
MCEVYSNPDATAKMWKYGRIEPGVGPILWRVWIKDAMLKARIERLKGVERVAEEWHLHEPSHHAWYFHIPSHMKGRIAAILGITGVVNTKLQAETERRARRDWGKSTRFAKRERIESGTRKREPVEVGGGRG